jgi:hypothetical protein
MTKALLDRTKRIFTLSTWSQDSQLLLFHSIGRRSVKRQTNMRDYRGYRKTAIRYWERRRIIYNLALIPPALLGYGITDLFNYVGDPHETQYGFVVFWLLLSAIGANVCYSFAYALEFFFGNDEPTSRWLQSYRTSVFVCGVLFATLLSLVGGRNIAEMEFHQQNKQNAERALYPNRDGSGVGGTNSTSSSLREVEQGSKR